MVLIGNEYDLFVFIKKRLKGVRGWGVFVILDEDFLLFLWVFFIVCVIVCIVMLVVKWFIVKDCGVMVFEVLIYVFKVLGFMLYSLVYNSKIFLWERLGFVLDILYKNGWIEVI